ncbi:hypothetical protein BVC80_8673g8 [Macleaya cordata]|uniref:Uncharacterized protein n=1 Tax=Macleaya cordata TaxID=56857 RepID=A0A200PZP6_MACCD|nr:hypothetical protein BVC80_8673g8 [Macleaya cordata]
MCSPSTHPGSFRCSIHKNKNSFTSSSNPSKNERLNTRKSAMANLMAVPIDTVEQRDSVKKALAAYLILLPSANPLRRRSAIQPKPSRLSTMSKS